MHVTETYVFRKVMEFSPCNVHIFTIQSGCCVVVMECCIHIGNKTIENNRSSAKSLIQLHVRQYA